MKKLSPHVLIYKFPTSAISSILTRISGFYLSGCFVTVGISQVFDIDIHNKYKKLEKYQQKMLNYSIIGPLNYHTGSGIRHFVLDKYPQLLKNRNMVLSSYFLYSYTIISTIILGNNLEL